jgi:hypothetical protein
LEKEAKQREFFRSMEANILKAMDKGVVPGVHVNGHGNSNSNSLTEDMDVVKPLPIHNLTSSRKKIKKPTLIRTISSMDDEMIAELANDKLGNVSPDSTSTSFFDSLPQPGSQHSTSSRSPSVSSRGSSHTSHTMSHLKTAPPRPTNMNMNRLRAPKLSRVVTPPKDDVLNEVSKNLPKPTLGKRNTCGSLFISSTMADPDKDAAIKVSLGRGFIWSLKIHIIYFL